MKLIFFRFLYLCDKIFIPNIFLLNLQALILQSKYKFIVIMFQGVIQSCSNVLDLQ